jgi:transcriptional regulator with XRE-family HTH domain
MNNSPLESVFHAYRKAGSVEALAKELDVSEQSVDNWLNMRTRPQRSILESIIDYATRKPSTLPEEVVVITRMMTPSSASVYGYADTNACESVFLPPHIVTELHEKGYVEGDVFTARFKPQDHSSAPYYCVKVIR